MLKKVPVGIDSRHLHLTQEHFRVLFGHEARPRRLKAVTQPGYYACWQTVKLIGPKRELEGVRVICPWRPYTQVEITRSDAIYTGIKAPLKKSGDIAGSAAAAIVGPSGQLDLKEGCLVSWRHMHMSPREAVSLGLKNNDFVRVRAGNETGREVVFENVWVRAYEWYRLEFHVDTDEANAGGLTNSSFVEILGLQEGPPPYREYFPEETETIGWREHAGNLDGRF
ncbi:MAG: phosphate propanoyltransferase [Elusimicrobia bacterium]|nr:phosphate propanoyltransferase [Elusimicrobiota bacterium]